MLFVLYWSYGLGKDYRINTELLKSLCTLVQTQLILNKRVAHLVSKKDIQTIIHRADLEGLGFFTKALPNLGKSLREGLESGVLPPTCGFEYHNGRPLFLRGLFQVIFDSSGNLRPSTLTGDSVQCILQTVLLFRKLELPLESKQVQKAWNEFKETQERCRTFEYAIDPYVLQTARALVFETIGHLSYDDLENLRFRMSSGAVAERGVTVQDRWMQPLIKGAYHGRLDTVFPMTDYLYANTNHMVDSTVGIHTGDEECKLPESARIAFVPKDTKGPRTICCEPAIHQAVKLGLMDLLVDKISASRNGRHMPFSDQTIMRELALQGSLTQCIATMDLSKASDTVTMWHIEQLFPDSWVDALRCIRSNNASFQHENGEIETVELHTAFPMGSAVCFPVESLIFWSISSAYCVLNQEHKTYVFGDDTIIPTSCYEGVSRHFSSCGFLVNEDKSYSRGLFRESCGGDYWNGVFCKPHYIKKLPGLSPRTENECRLSLIAYLNSINLEYGYNHDLLSFVEKAFLTTPFVVDQSGVEILGPFRSSNNLFYSIKTNRDTYSNKCYRGISSAYWPCPVRSPRNCGKCSHRLGPKTDSVEIRLPRIRKKKGINQQNDGWRLLWKYFCEKQTADLNDRCKFLDGDVTNTATFVSNRDTAVWEWCEIHHAD